MLDRAENGKRNGFNFHRHAFITELHERYLENPASVDASWAAAFTELNDDADAIQKDVSEASWAKSITKILGQGQAGSRRTKKLLL